MAEEKKNQEKNVKHVDYTEVQVDICDIARQGEGAVPPPEVEYCPSCIIDENAPEREWWREPHPYLNGRTCEYYIPVAINADGDTFNTRQLRDVRIPFNIFKYSFLRPGIRKALQFYNKVNDDLVVCAMLPEGQTVGKSPAPKKQLYKNNKLWPHLGKMFVQTKLTDKNGDQFSIQEVNQAVVSQFKEITNPDALELFSYVKDYHLGNGLEPIKMLVAIPAYVFDQIPTSIAASLGKDKDDESDEEKDLESNLKTEVELDPKTLQKQLRSMEVAFGAWQKYQALFYTVQKGRMKQAPAFNKKAMSQEPNNFYVKNYTKKFAFFRDALEDLLSTNGYFLTHKEHPSLPEKIKISFELPTKDKPYRIKKVEARHKNCDYEPCSINFEKFNTQSFAENGTFLNYVANMDESVMFIEQMENTPWVDWIDQYTYPKVQIQYGDVNPTEVPCVEAEPDPDDVDDAMFKLDFDFGDALGWLLSSLNCKTLKDMEDYDPFDHVGSLQNQFAKLLEGFTFTDNDAIADLFGLPLNFHNMRGKSPLRMVSEIWERLTLCNLLSLILEIIKCLFGGFSLDELLKILILKILKNVAAPLFKVVFEALENVPCPSLIVEGGEVVGFDWGTKISLVERVRVIAPMRLGGFETPPWDYWKEIDEEEDAGDYVKWYLGGEQASGRTAPMNTAAALANRPGGGAVAGDIIDAYTEPSKPSGPESSSASYQNTHLGLAGGLPGLGIGYHSQLDLYEEETGLGPAPEQLEDPPPPFKRVFDVWVEETIECLENFDEILKLVENMPGGQLVQIVIAIFGCPNKNFLKELISELKNMINLGGIVKGCAFGEPVFRIPKLPLPLNFMPWKDILRILLNIIVKKLLDLIAMLLLMILLKILLALSCSNLKALIDGLLNGFPDEDAFKEALDEGFCGDDEKPPEDLDTLLGVLDKNGVSGTPDDIADLAKDLAGGLPKDAFKRAFLNPPEQQDPDLCAQIADTINARHPQFSDTLGDPERVAMFLSGVGNLMTRDQKDAIRASLGTEELDSPIDPSICLTNDQKKAWDAGRRAYIDDLCGNMPMDAQDDDLWPYPEEGPVSPTLGDDWVGKVNDRDTAALDEYLDMFLNGPAAALGPALGEALKAGVINCAIDPETGEPIEIDDDDAAANKSVLPPIPVELTDLMDDAKKTMMFSAEQSFYNDLQGKYHSFFNHLLADTYNAPFYQGTRRRPSHTDLVKHPFIAPNAADTPEQWGEKWDTVKDRFVFPRFFMQMFAPRDEDFKTNTDSPFPSNVYPQTIGIWMRQKLLEEAEDLEFSTNMSLQEPRSSEVYTRLYTNKRWGYDEKAVGFRTFTNALPKEEMILSFRDNNGGKGGGWTYGFNLKLINYAYDQNGDQTLEPAYTLVLEELDSTNVPDTRSFSARYGLAVEAPATIKVTRDTRFVTKVGVNPGNASSILNIYSSVASDSELKNYNLSGVVLKNYIKNVYSAMGIDLSVSDSYLAKDLFEKLNGFVYSSVINSLMDNPEGESVTLPGYTIDDEVVESEELTGVPSAFLFGYVDDSLTRADLTYVSPDATGNEDTWEYEHKNKEKILGKSATEHPRVEFLDPEIHEQGKYTKPNIYIKPPEYKGWLAVNQLVLPEDDNHEPARKMFLFTDDLIKKEKDLKDEIPMDERLADPRKCTHEGPFDAFSDPSGHAGVHVSVVAMCRLFAFEHLLKSMGMYMILKPDYNNNYDESVLASIVENMQEEIKDMPRRRSKKGFFNGYSGWLLFLEQAAQTAERMVIIGDLQPTPEITQALNEMNKVRKAHVPLTKKWLKLFKHVRTVTWDDAGEIIDIQFAYSRKINGKRKYYPLQYDIPDDELAVLKSYLDSVMFYSLGRNYRSILSNETRNFAFRMRRRQKRLFRLAAKIHGVHNTQESAKALLKYIVGQQLTFYGNKMNEIASDEERAGPKPKAFVDNLKKYFFGSSGTIITPLNGGKTEEEDSFRQAVADAAENSEEAPIYDYGGDIRHVIHDPSAANPTDSFSAKQITKLQESLGGNFYFEKYLRIIDKPDGHQSETKYYQNNQKQIVSSRDDLLSGVVNIKEFQNFLKDNLTALSSLAKDEQINEEGEVEELAYFTKISNIFGDATPIYEEQEAPEEGGDDGDEPPPPKLIAYDGSIGIKFGVRLCYIPPADFDPTITTAQARAQSSFLFKAPVNDLPDHNAKKIFPLVSYEKDLSDKEIVDLDLSDDNFGEDLNCYIHELLKTPEFDLIFDYCAPIKRASSMLAVYSDFAFLASVGEHPLERDNNNGQRPTEYWKSVVLSQTKNSLRSLFIANYQSVLFYSEKVGSKKDGFKFNPFELYKKLFQILINPFAFFGNLAADFGGWRIGRRVVDRPYDMYGNPEGADDGVE